MDKTIVVMAAGLGSRYGGVKQIERLGPTARSLWNTPYTTRSAPASTG